MLCNLHGYWVMTVITLITLITLLGGTQFGNGLTVKLSGGTAFIYQQTLWEKTESGNHI